MALKKITKKQKNKPKIKPFDMVDAAKLIEKIRKELRMVEIMPGARTGTKNEV